MRKPNRQATSRGRRRLIVEALEDRRVMAYVAETIYDAFNSGPRELTVVGETLFFVGSDSSGGEELWKSDGTTAGTTPVKDIFSGTTGSNPSSLTNVDDILYFTAADESRIRELWKSDGTPEGTVRVRDINLADPKDLTNVGGTLFFTADDGVNGRELWKSDGTYDGTVMVKELAAGSAGIEASNLTAVNDQLFFSREDSGAPEIWKSDGTEEGTLVVLRFPSTAGAFFTSSDFHVHEGRLYFLLYANHIGASVISADLWTTDGTAEGTIQIQGAGASSHYGLHLEVGSLEGAVYVLSDDGGASVVRTGETSATKVGEFTLASLDSAAVSSAIYFGGRSYNNDNLRQGLVKVDESGETLLLPDVFPVTFTTFDDKAFFNSRTGEFWYTDGTPSGTGYIVGLPVSTFGGLSFAQMNDLGLFLSDGGASLVRIQVDRTPTLTSRQALSVAAGTTGTILNSHLSAIDPNGESSKVVYHVSEGPSYGSLQFVSSPGVSVTSFSQADIDDQRLVYKNYNSASATDGFRFTLSDAEGITTGPYEFEIRLRSAASTRLSMVNEGARFELQLVDTKSGGKADRLTYGRDDQGYFFIRDHDPDPGRVIYVDSSVSGVFGSGTKQVRIPASSLNASTLLRFRLGNGDDIVRIDTQGNARNPIPAGGLEIDLGAGVDTLQFINNTTPNTWLFADPKGGYVNVGAFGDIEFSGIDRAVGGAHNDLFRLLNPRAAGLVLDGGTGANDAVELQTDADMTLAALQLTVASKGTTRRFSLHNLESALLYGGPSKNVLDARKFGGSATIQGYGGNDMILGTAKADLLVGGEGHDVIVGFGGDDVMQGGNGRDLLIGGLGTDAIDGGAGEDILIGGTTVHDNNKAAIHALLAAWIGNETYAARINKIQNLGVGSPKVRLNSGNVKDDGKVDVLRGQGELDWFFAQLASSKPGKESPDRQAGEIIVGIS